MSNCTLRKVFLTSCNQNFFLLSKKELQQDVENHSETHDKLDSTAEGITKVCVEEVSSVEDDIQNIDKRWDELNKNLENKHADIEALQGQLHEYKEAVKGADEKISAVETELNAARTPVSDVEEMKKHIEELEALKDQLEELKPEVQSTLETGQNLQDKNPQVRNDSTSYFFHSKVSFWKILVLVKNNNKQTKTNKLKCRRKVLLNSFYLNWILSTDSKVRIT